MVFRFRTAIHMMCGNLQLHPPTSQSFRLQESEAYTFTTPTCATCSGVNIESCLSLLYLLNVM